MNPLLEYHANVAEYPNRYSDEIKKMCALQKKMLKKYDFIEEKGAAVVGWIERNCILPQGERAGERVRLMLWQKWMIYSIFCFWGEVEEPEFDDTGNTVGTTRKYLRVVNDILMVIASGNSKTTFMGFLNAYLLFSKKYPAANIYIGSNAQEQSSLCYNATAEIIRKNKALAREANIVASRHLITNTGAKGTNSLILAMSRDGNNYEGINPTNIMIDEIHAMKTSDYADNLRKSTKRDDRFTFETTTMGTVRGGYLDNRLEYAEKVLNGDIENDRFFCCIFKQDSEEEIYEAYKNDDMSVLLKSNPGLGQAVSVTLLKDQIKKMTDDPSKRVAVLTKNFNIPQNPVTCYFTDAECRAKPFDESIFNGAPVFLGLDMAYTRNPDNDFACLSILTVNPITDEEYYKDFYFLPKYWERNLKIEDKVVIERWDMVKAKSKADTGIAYDEKTERYGYRELIDKGFVTVIDEELVRQVGAYCNDNSVFCDCTGVTQKFIIYYIAWLEKVYGFTVCKMGLDPNFANEIETTVNGAVKSTDGMPPVIKFRMERKDESWPIMEATKDVRARGLVYCNNKLTELHFYNAEAKDRGDGTYSLVHTGAARKDGVIAHFAARSAYNVFVNNKFTGARNKEQLAVWWAVRMKELKSG